VIGYTPAKQAIRAVLDQPPDTGADDPDTSHDHPGAQPEGRNSHAA
jgi:hypothetical protein